MPSQAQGFQIPWKAISQFRAQGSWETIFISFLVPWKFMEPTSIFQSQIFFFLALYQIAWNTDSYFEPFYSLGWEEKTTEV